MNTLPSPTPTPGQIRDDLVNLVRRDLLGPHGGPYEIVDENSVSRRYLVGMLAPRREPIPRTDEDDIAEAGTTSTQDGSEDPVSPPADSVFPSSMGLTVTVDRDCALIHVGASWGRYERTERGEHGGDPDSQGGRVWRRTPVEGFCKIELKDGSIHPQPLSKDQPEVRVHL